MWPPAGSYDALLCRQLPFSQFDLWGYHLVNLMLHVLCGILVFFLARRFSPLSLARGGQRKNENQPLVFLVCPYFCIHPLQVNTVTTSSRERRISHIFYLLCLLLFISGSLKRGRQEFSFTWGRRLVPLFYLFERNGVYRTADRHPLRFHIHLQGKKERVGRLRSICLYSFFSPFTCCFFSGRRSPSPPGAIQRGSITPGVTF